MQSGLPLDILQRSSSGVPFLAVLPLGMYRSHSPVATGDLGLHWTGSPSRPHRIFGDSVLTPSSFAFLILWVTIPPVELGLPVLKALNLCSICVDMESLGQ